MSKAYRVLEIKIGPYYSFNFDFDPEITRWLSKNTSFFSKLIDNTGFTEVWVKDLERMLSEIGHKLTNDTVEVIKADIKSAKREGNDYVMYFCYD